MSKLRCVTVIAFTALILVSQHVPAKESLSSYDPQVKELLAKMTLEEKIGQMIQAEHSALKDPADIRTYYIGSILSGATPDPKEGNSMEAWAALYEGLQQQALKTRLRIPLLCGIDAVHGHNNVLGAVIFPHNIGMGCTRNPELVETAARLTAVEVRATGFNWVFAPCVTVPQDERWGRTYEGFSENPELAAILGAAAVRGFQGSDLSDPLSVLACGKHFVADGGTVFGTSANGKGLDQGDAQITEQILRKIHLPPYPAVIKEGVGSIMPSYSSWNGVKCSAHKYLLTDVLKGELGFEGFLISDYRAIQQIDPDYKKRFGVGVDDEIDLAAEPRGFPYYKKCVGIAVNAGMDMAMEPKGFASFFQSLKELVEEKVVPMSRIDDAVTRILRVKFAMGLMKPDYDYKANRDLQRQFGSEAHRAVASQAVRESMVVLKNEKKTLPLSKTLGRLHISGRAADDIGIQCGGWTITWQGSGGPVTTGGTTLLEAVRKTVSNQTNVTFSQDGSGCDGAEIGIVVIGEDPYAEGIGDRNSLALSKEDIAAFQNFENAGIPTVVILYSGRPLIINEVLDQSEAFIAAWLPGTEGLGITDVIFGDYKPTGKLGFTWPRSMSQIPINIGDNPYDPLFPYGYGLTW